MEKASDESTLSTRWSFRSHTFAKAQATPTRDGRKKEPFGKALDLEFLYAHSSRSKTVGETSDKKYWKEKKKQRCFKPQQAWDKNLVATGVSTTKVNDGAHNDRAHNGGARNGGTRNSQTCNDVRRRPAITAKKGYYAKNCPRLQDNDLNN